jgi:peroxiredoxin Q/BCP
MRQTLGIGAAVCALLLCGGFGMAGGKLKVGDKVDKIEGTDESGKTFSAGDLLGKKTIVLYFYPADFTGGCTNQACGFRDNIEKLTAKDIAVIGVSGDTAETHAKFKKHHMLPFTLLADTEGKLATHFGVPYTKGEKSATVKVDGKEMTLIRPGTAQRYTVVIAKDRSILAVDPVKDAKGDSERILKLVSK